MIFNFHSNMNNIKFSENKLFVSEATLQKAPVCLSVSPSQNLVRTTPPKRLDGLS